jgi:hypothetical protein
MKKLLIMLSAVAMMTSCGYKAKQEAMQSTIDSLAVINKEKDQTMELLSSTMADIQNNLNTIKEKEGIINNLANGDATQKDQMKADLEAIYQLLVQNKEKVTKLQSQLKKQGKKAKEYESIISVLESQIKQQNEQIANLTATLEEKDIEIGYLNNAVIRLSSSVDSLATAKADTDSKLQEATDNLQTGFYIIAEKTDLLNSGIIEKGGLFKKKILSGDVDNSKFTRVNTTEVEEIALNTTKEVKVLTNHDDNSYVIEPDAAGSMILKIKDKESFWKVSKYLVVQTK